MKKILNYLFCFCCFIFLFLLTSCLGDKPSSSLGGSNGSDKKIYTITYNYNATTLVGTPTSEFLDYASVVLPSVVKTGYIFDGWYEGDTKVEKITENRDYNLTARFNVINYSITYILDGGELNTGIELEIPLSYTINSDDILFDDYEDCFIKEGYVFDGLYLDSNFSKPCKIIRSGNHEDITLYAKWNKNYTITFDSNGGSEVKPIVFTNSSICFDMASSPDCRPTKEGYIFLGWYDEDDNRVEYLTYHDMYRDITLYAKWKKVITVTLDYDGGVCTIHGDSCDEKIIELSPGETKSLPLTIEKIGYSFMGWNIPNNVSVISISYDDLEGDTIIPIIWRMSGTIFFDSNGGTEIEPIECHIGPSLDISSDSKYIPTKEGYRFLGWYDAEGNQITSIDQSEFYNFAIHLTLRAKWESLTYSEDYVYDSSYNGFTIRREADEPQDIYFAVSNDIDLSSVFNVFIYEGSQDDIEIFLKFSKDDNVYYCYLNDLRYENMYSLDFELVKEYYDYKVFRILISNFIDGDNVWFEFCGFTFSDIDDVEDGAFLINRK